MKRIIVTTDFSLASTLAFPKALDYAKLVLKEGVEVAVIAVLEDLIPVSVQFEFGLTYLNNQGLHEEILKSAKDRLDSLIAEHFSANALASSQGSITVVPQVIRATRPVSVEITECARLYGADLIVIATHGRSGLGHFVIGSVAERVVRDSTCPVLVVPARGAQ